MTVPQLATRFAPSAATMDMIGNASILCIAVSAQAFLLCLACSVRAAAYLHRSGASSVEQSAIGWIDATFPVTAAETLLHAEFHAFRHRRTRQVLKRSLDGLYELPEEIADHIDLVEGWAACVWNTWLRCLVGWSVVLFAASACCLWWPFDRSSRCAGVRRLPVLRVQVLAVLLAVSVLLCHTRALVSGALVWLRSILPSFVTFAVLPPFGATTDVACTT